MMQGIHHENAAEVRIGKGQPYDVGAHRVQGAFAVRSAQHLMGDVAHYHLFRQSLQRCCNACGPATGIEQVPVARQF